ncbi:phosphoribosyltransferase family protein [Orbaceae bacterium ESL0727]|nr:phosphoribosyltransferase family protein [Orbaceae bacterium ESL0727]
MRCFLCQLPLQLAHHGICSRCVNILPRLNKVCPQCSLPHSLPAKICYRCRATKPNWDKLIAVSDYIQPLKKVIHHLKFYQKIELTLALARLLFLAWYDDYLQGKLCKPDLVTCVPLHHSRYWSRGFNQSQLLAKPVAHWLNRPFLPYLLQRQQKRSDQKKLSLKARSINVKALFACQTDLTGKTVLVIDDIVTTGNTIKAISEQLKKHGAAHIQILCLCRTLL